MADGWVSSDGGMLTLDTPALMIKWIRDMYDEQSRYATGSSSTEHGCVPSIVPAEQPTGADEHGTCHSMHSLCISSSFEGWALNRTINWTDATFARWFASQVMCSAIATLCRGVLGQLSCLTISGATMVTRGRSRSTGVGCSSSCGGLSRPRITRPDL